VISEIADRKKTDEALIYAKWAASQIDDTTIVIDKLAPFLRERLDVAEPKRSAADADRTAQAAEKKLGDSRPTHSAAAQRSWVSR